MADVSKIDRNFAVETSLKIDNIQFYNVQDQPFTIYGVNYEGGVYRRMPESVAKAVSPNVYKLHTNTAGGRVKFITNSNFVAIKAAMPVVGKMPHFPLTGSVGFDLYVGKKEEYYGTFKPPYTITDGYESVLQFGTRKQREITINFPPYSSVSSLYIGLEADATVKKSAGYKYTKPIGFYGSSITQGGCVSRPGNVYENIISRNLQVDHINLGFAGSALAEDLMAEYISKLDLSVFVYDYDHNAPTPQYLQETHQKMFLTIRKKNPTLPIVMLARPKYRLNELDKMRLEIIRKTYEDALAAGDQNVYFIDGPTLMKYAKNEGTVDNCHPNDLGFYSMAKVLTPLLRKLL